MQLIEHGGVLPRVDPSAYVAPTAVLCGDVSVGADCRILFGAVLTAEDGPVQLGARCIVMEHAVLRGRRDHPARLGDGVLVGPHAHVNGVELDDGVFVATGAALFPGARLGRGAEVRINGVVHVNTTLPAEAVVPIGWVAVGDPARIMPPSAHDEIWAVQRELDFMGTVTGLPREARADSDRSMDELIATYVRLYGEHLQDRVVEP
jgi:carbonic anhydrase/acetyltransferase-like protein (isoleucine patch superfamily)